MAPSMTSFQTETTVNISQNFHSSVSPPSGSNQEVEVRNAVEWVEDSVEDSAYRKVATEPAQAALLDDEDELYSLSPQVKASSQKKRQSTAELRPEVSADNTLKPWKVEELGRQETADKPKGKTSHPSNDANGSLTHDVKVHESQQSKKRTLYDKAHSKITEGIVL